MSQDSLNKVLATFARSPRVAILLSGAGSNARVILENRSNYPSISFIATATDDNRSNAAFLAKTFRLNHLASKEDVSTKEGRNAYFERLIESLERLQVDALVYAGFMRISPVFFVQKYPAINIHPADLRIVNIDGEPRYTGMTAIRDAILAGERYIASTVHVVEERVDCGAPITVSRKIPVSARDATNIAEVHQRLKTTCEHELYPKTLKLLSMNKISAEDTPLQIEKVDLLLAR